MRLGLHRQDKEAKCERRDKTRITQEGRRQVKPMASMRKTERWRQVSPTHRLHEPLWAFDGGVSPLGSLARGFVLAKSWRRASLILSNLLSTLPSKCCWRLSSLSKRASRESRRASSVDALEGKIWPAQEAGSADWLFFFPLPAPLTLVLPDPLDPKADVSCWMRI